MTSAARDLQYVASSAHVSAMLNGSAPASGPTLLPDPVASMVSLISKSTSISIRIGSMVGNVLLDTARASTMTSLELSRAAVEGIVRRGSQGVVARRGRDVELDGWASKGLTAFNTSVSITELILSTAIELGQTTLSSISGIADTSVLTIDSIFGSTETSRAIHEVVRLVRKEFKDSSEDDGEVSVKDIVAGLTCFAILQYRTHKRLDANAATSGRLVWDVVVDTIPPSDLPEQHQENDRSRDLMTVDRSVDEANTLPPVLFKMFPPNAEIKMSTTSTTTSTTTIEVVGASPPDFTPPPGAVILSEISHHDGRQRYKIVYETVTRKEHSKKLSRDTSGDVEMVNGGERMQNEQRVFEIDDSKDEGRKRRKHKKHSQSSRRKELKPKCLLSGSETDRPPPVPRRSKRESTTSDGNSTSKPKHSKKRDKERVKDDGKEKEGAMSSLKRAFSSSTNFTEHSKEKRGSSRSNEKVMHMPVAHRPPTMFNSAGMPIAPPRNRRHSITSGTASPEVRYSSRPPSRSAFHSESYSSTTSHDGYLSATNLHAQYAPRTTRDSPGPRPSSAISITSYDGGDFMSQKNYVPSIYTLHTSQSAASLRLLYDPPTSDDPGPCYPADFHMVHNMRKYMRFAAASYGAQFMRFLLGSQFAPIDVQERSHHLEHQAFSFHTHLPVDTILLSSHYDPSGGFDSSGHTGTGRPLVHFVCVDHEAAAIVVTCRGTLGLEDVLTDLTCKYTTITLRGRTYRVHKGMHASATLLLQSSLLSILANTLQSYPNYGLVLTGHSLGGGVAALVSILIAAPDNSTGQFVTSHPSLPADRPIHCYAFGSPAIVCERLRNATRGLVTTVVNGNDIVPSLSIGVVRDFHSVALSFREDTGGVLGEIRRRFLKGLWGGRGISSEEEWNWELAVLKTLRAGMTSEKLVPPGEVWRVQSESTLGKGVVAGNGKAGRSRVRAWVVDDVERRFGEVRFGGGFFADHNPASYEVVLEALRRGVLEDSDDEEEED